MDGLTEGRIVHYVLPDGPNQGEHRPMIVVKVWDKTHGTINGQQFHDGQNDGANQEWNGVGGTIWRTSIAYSEGKELNTWHWIEPA